MPQTTLGELEYRGMPYRRAGQSGLLLPVFALGMWHSFGEHQDRRTQAALITGAFERGVTHFDNANRYEPRTAMPRPCLAMCWHESFVRIATRSP